MTAYEMRISDWSSYVCSSDLMRAHCSSSAVVAKRLPRVVVWAATLCERPRSEERREGKSVSVRVDLGGRRNIKRKNHTKEGIDIGNIISRRIYGTSRHGLLRE